MMKVTFFALFAAFVTFLTLFDFVSASNNWPDSTIKQPKDFKAFYTTDSTPCNVEIVFKRELNDTKYDYHVFGQYPSGEIYLEPDSLQDDSYLPFSVVNTTADGQRGAYDLGNGFTLLPFTIMTCDQGALGGVEYFTVKAFQKGEDPYSDQPFWISKPFNVIDKVIVPQGGGVSLIKATQSRSNSINVQWEVDNQKNIEGFFIIVGRQYDSQLYNVYITDPFATQTTIQVSNPPTQYAVTVVLYDKNGAVPVPNSCTQVAVRLS